MTTASGLDAPELRSLLRRSERTPGWLANKVGLSRTQIVRWTEIGVPVKHEVRVRGLLVPLPEDAP